MNSRLSNFPYFLFFKVWDLSKECGSENHSISTWFYPSACLSVPKSLVIDKTALECAFPWVSLEMLWKHWHWVLEAQLPCPLPKDKKFSPSLINHNWVHYLKYRGQVHSTYSFVIMSHHCIASCIPTLWCQCKVWQLILISRNRVSTNYCILWKGLLQDCIFSSIS